MTTIERISTEQVLPYLDNPNILPKAEWHQLLEQEVAAAKENGDPLSVAFIDVDNLKCTNDTLGHAEGDRVIDDLQHAIRLVQNSFRVQNTDGVERQLDVVAVSTSTEVNAPNFNIESRSSRINSGRIGGDEFAVLCHTDAEGMKVIVNRLRETFRNAISETLKELDVDISIGTNTLEPEMSALELLRGADERLLAEKESHLIKLSEEGIIALRGIAEVLRQLNVRPSQYPKYARRYILSPIENPED